MELMETHGRKSTKIQRIRMMKDFIKKQPTEAVKQGMLVLF